MTTITPADIRAGDFLLRDDGTAAWVALADAAPSPNPVGFGTLGTWTAVPVEHADGGRDADGRRDKRYWEVNSGVTFAVVTDTPTGRGLRLATGGPR